MRRRSLVLVLVVLALAVFVAMWRREPTALAARVAATIDSRDRAETADLAESSGLSRGAHASSRKQLTATEPAAWRVVDHATGALVLAAAVECTDSRGQVSTSSIAGCFEPIGEAPFLLEVAAQGYATRWVLLVDAEPVDVWLWRSGSAIVRVVDEAGHAVPAFAFELAPPERNHEGEPATSCVSLFEHFVEEGEPIDLAELEKRPGRRALDPQCSFPVGPSSDWLYARTDREGSVHFDGLPIGDYSVRTEDERTVRSTALGTPLENQLGRVFRSAPANLAAGATIEFELVRSGSAAARVFLGPSAFDIEADLHRVNDTLGATRPWRRSRATVNYETLDDVNGEVRLVGMDPGRHLLSLRWQVPPADGCHAEESQICFKELVFDVTAGVDVDLGIVEPDAGRLELEFEMVDPDGAPIAPALAFELRDAVRDPERNPAELDVRLEIDGTVVSSRTDFNVPLEEGCRRLVVRGAPRSPRRVTLEPDVDEPTGLAHWAFDGPSTHVVPSEADGRVTIPVVMHASQTMTFVATLPVEDASRDLALVPNGIFAVTLTEVSTGHVHEFALVAKTAFSARLEATTTVPLGRWRTSNHLVVPCRSDIEYFNSDGRWHTNLIDCERAEWFVLHEEVVVSLDVEAVHEFTPLRATRARIVGNGTGVDLFRRLQPSERAVQWSAGAPAAWVRLTGCDMENLALELDDTAIELFGLPPNSRVRLCENGFEFETGPPGSTVEVVCPAAK
jgi:hypothetical protein